MDADLARFDISPEDYSCFLRFIERVSSELSSDPDVQADLGQEMWTKCFILLDDPPASMPTTGSPRNQYLMTSMAHAARRFKPFDAPLGQNHKPEYDRVTEYEDKHPTPPIRKQG